MNIIKRHIDDLVPAEYNPRVDLKPGDKEYDKLKRSIEEFGYVEPIIYNKRNNTVVGGHQRLKVLKELGYTDIDVVEVDLNDNDEKALNIALNKVSGDWDNEKLEELLNELNNEADFDISLTGFEEDEIEELLKSAMESLSGEQGDDDYDINPDELDESFELNNKEPEFVTMTFTVSRYGRDIIKSALESIINSDDFKNSKGENKNGTALCEVIKQWTELKKLNLK